MEAHKWNRRKACQNNLKTFALTYFKHYFTSEFSIMHEELFETLPAAVMNGEIDKIVRAAPRGNAKSTIVSFVLVMWCAVFEYKHFIMMVSDTASQANDFLTAVKTELEENDLLRRDFGNLQGSIWSSSDIILKNGVRIQALGVGKKIRGRKNKQYRPDLIVCDDLENDENIESPEQRKKIYSWYTKALSKAGNKTTDYIVIGTILHPDSLLAKLLKNPTYDAIKYKAIIEWSASPLWDSWTNIITDLLNPNRLKDGLTFYLEHKDEMLAGTQVLWEAGEDYYQLMLQFISDGPAAFHSEKQNEPINDDDRRFEPQWIQYYEDEDLLSIDLIKVGYIDPSLGKKGGDYSAIIFVGMDPNSFIYVLVADIRRRHPDLIIDDSVSHQRVWHISKLGVENVQFQELFKDLVARKLEALQAENKALSLTVRGVEVHTDKVLRIQSLQADIKNGRIKFKRDQTRLIEQLINFPTGDHDDGPDALAGAVQMLGSSQSTTKTFFKEQANELQAQKSVTSFLRNSALQGNGERLFNP